MRLLALTWGALAVAVFGVDVVAPATWWGALIALPFNAAGAPVALWIAYYLLFGPRYARRYWLTLRFLLANWTRVDVIVARGPRSKPSSPSLRSLPLPPTKQMTVPHCV